MPAFRRPRSVRLYDLVRYGFVIDQTRCIGCHACTVACKEENRVPLGAFRTWVKYVERGEFPHTRRHFAVLRCNHCDHAPCVTICPTVALYRRADGIVDFDRDRCIGCKSCMQACPYDALYIDPDTHTAAKCHFCAHRVERSLEPACVIVCPERAILAGDLDDPGSEVARVLAREQVLVRKPEQGTRPKVFYVGADAATLTPQVQRPGAATLWGQRPAAAGAADGEPMAELPRTPKAIPCGRSTTTPRSMSMTRRGAWSAGGWQPVWTNLRESPPTVRTSGLWIRVWTECCVSMVGRHSLPGVTRRILTST